MVKLPNKSAVRKAHISGILFGYGQYIKFAIIGVIFWAASLFVRYYDLDPADVYVAVYCIFLGALGTGSAFSQVPDVGKARQAASEIFDIMDETSQIDSRSKEGKTEIEKGEIQFKRVNFTYPSRKDEKVLQGMNLTVKEKCSVALVGASGSGKSTIASLLLRFY